MVWVVAKFGLRCRRVLERLDVLFSGQLRHFRRCDFTAVVLAVCDQNNELGRRFAVLESGDTHGEGIADRCAGSIYISKLHLAQDIEHHAVVEGQWKLEKGFLTKTHQRNPVVLTGFNKVAQHLHRANKAVGRF